MLQGFRLSVLERVHEVDELFHSLVVWRRIGHGLGHLVRQIVVIDRSGCLDSHVAREESRLTDLLMVLRHSIALRR